MCDGGMDATHAGCGRGRVLPCGALSARGAGHHVQHQRDHAIDAKPGGVDADGVVGRPQWRHRATGIAGIAGENLAQQTVECDGNPFVFQLLIAPLGTLVGARGQEHLVAGIGKITVPMSRPSATSPGNCRNARWRSFRAARTSGMAAIAEAAAPAVSVRSSSVAS
jgi:hypothetical protein